MHEQNDEFIRQRDEFTRQMKSVEREKTLTFFGYFLYEPLFNLR